MLSTENNMQEFASIRNTFPSVPSNTLQHSLNTLARPELMNAARASYDDKCAEDGFDVMKLSTSGNCCDHCAKWEERLFSLTGATAGLPTNDDLIADGVFHPNCTHSYSLVPKFIMERDYNQDGTKKTEGQKKAIQITPKAQYHIPIKYKSVSHAEMQKYREDWKDELSQITDKQKDGFEWVTSDFGRALNKYLREKGTGGWDESSLKRWSDNASSMFDKVKNTSDVIMFRCLEDASFLPDVGGVHTEKGFSSCSVSPRLTFGKTVLEVHVLTGCRGAYIESVSTCPWENEFLLDKNIKYSILSKNKIRISGEDYDRIVVEVEK